MVGSVCVCVCMCVCFVVFPEECKVLISHRTYAACMTAVTQQFIQEESKTDDKRGGKIKGLFWYFSLNRVYFGVS